MNHPGQSERTLRGKTVLMSGGSRGIGLAIARRAAEDGANVAVLAKTAEPHPALEGTVHTAAAEIEERGGRALPIVGDVRDERDVRAAVRETAAEFGGIDICVNNASAIDLSGSTDLPMKKYDLMHDINVRGTFVLTRECVPHLRESVNPHVLTLSPPLNMSPHWLGAHVGYLLSKYGMSLATLGFGEEFRDAGVAANGLWPRTLIATAAVGNLLGGAEALERARRPELVADAAHAVLTRDSRSCTGNLFLCEDVLDEEGVADLRPYAVNPEVEPTPDIFVD